VSQPSPVSTHDAPPSDKTPPRLVYVFHRKTLGQRLFKGKSLLPLVLSLLAGLTVIIAHVISTPTLPEIIATQIEQLSAEPQPKMAQVGLAQHLMAPIGQPGSSLKRLGHFAFPLAQEHQLRVMASYSKAGEQRFEKFRPEATLALMRLMDAARADGVWIVPVSAFRDYQRQEELFQARIAQLGSEQAAAKSVAPPGFSEHHTGYAVDLADGLARASDIAYSFGDTAAYRWLQANASTYGFQLSFPPNNPQGVNYEPWHWRFVGSPQAALTFSKAS
jgi:zinc D-Ala-D-Ala carboxypeptidase